jgi:hypothetical protein
LLDIYWNILTMHGPINVKAPNNTSKWQMGFNSTFKGLMVPRAAMWITQPPIQRIPVLSEDAECTGVGLNTELPYTPTWHIT